MQKYIETQEDLEPIRLSRFKMEKFVHLPIFKKLVMNCFVRIGIGQYQGRSVYTGVIQSWTFTYIRLLNKSHENEITLRG